MNGMEHGKGCSGAVWQDGSPSKQYCGNDPKYPWWSNCCTWHEGRCVPKNYRITSTGIETLSSVLTKIFSIIMVELILY